MSYKNAQPKIADTLSVFIEQIEKIEKSTISLQKISEGINTKMDLFYQYEPKINFLPLENINREYINIMEKKKSELHAVLYKHLDKLEQERKQKDTFFFNFSIIIAILFLVTVAATYLSFKSYYQKQKVEELLEKSEAIRQKNKEQLDQLLKK